VEEKSDTAPQGAPSNGKDGPLKWVYSVGGMTEAVPAKDAGSIDVEGISRWITSLFPARPFPAAFVGSSNGALVHVAAALGAPWLPQTFMCPVRQVGIDPDDPQQGFELKRIGPVGGMPSPLAPDRFEVLAIQYGPRFGITVEEMASGRVA
jgi:hypothetical protein